MADRDLYVFDAELQGFERVARRVALLDDQTLVDLHRVLQEAFGSADTTSTRLAERPRL